MNCKPLDSMVGWFDSKGIWHYGEQKPREYWEGLWAK